LVSGRIAAIQRVKVHLTSNQPDELKTIFSETIDESFHEMRKAKASALSIRTLDAKACVLCMPDAGNPRS
jgi:hypothetical protein